MRNLRPFVRPLAPLLALLSTSGAVAQSYYLHTAPATELGIAPFVSWEASNKGQISSVGALFGFDEWRLLLAGSTFSSLQDGWLRLNPAIEFTNFDAALRYQLPGNYPLYLEGGVALNQLFDDDDDRHRHWQQQDGSTDWFVGVGGGFQFEHWSLLAFGRYRSLYSYQREYNQLIWPAETSYRTPEAGQWFAGVELSLRF